MNRAERRRTAKILKLRSPEGDLEEDACVLCAFVKVQIVGSRESLYKDKQDRLIELTISHRIEPPYGLRWPYDLQRRPPCHFCKGEGKLTVINLLKQEKTVRQCEDCLGLGRQLKGDEFAPLCQPCSIFVHNWLQARAKAHMDKYMTAGGRITIATMGDLAAWLTSGAVPVQPTGSARIALPGINR